MATGKSMFNSVHLDGIEAAQAAQLFEDTRLRSHQDDPMSSFDEYRNANRGDLMEMLEEVFETDRQVEFAFMLMAESYRLGGQ